MSNASQKILVTGGAGFIGSHLVRWLLENTSHSVINLDCLTYASNLLVLEEFERHVQYQFEKVDICDRESVRRVFRTHQPDCVFHLAAESHVDNSIEAPRTFVDSNIVGTFNLLEASREWVASTEKTGSDFRFIQVSTDEVFGSLGLNDPPCDEQSAYAPRSPYSATKAAADHLVHAWGATYGLPVITTRCSNNYGPWQYPEKLIPVVIQAAYHYQKIPVYGEGKNVRDWIHVTDHVHALVSIMEDGRTGCTYNISGDCELSNNALIAKICSLIDERRQVPQGTHEKLVEFVADRPGHDFRYAMSATQMAKTLDWEPGMNLDQGLRDTIQWYWNRTESGQSGKTLAE